MSTVEVSLERERVRVMGVECCTLISSGTDTESPCNCVWTVTLLDVAITIASSTNEAAAALHCKKNEDEDDFVDMEVDTIVFI
jgi:hypothetical protein